MRNQLPPILDVAMVAIDPNSIVRFGTPATLVAPVAAPPPVATTLGAALLPLQTAYPTSAPYTTQVNPTYSVPFSNSVNMDADLANYGTQLALNHIRFHIFRSSIQMEGAAWVNN
jgi:hypothetical protein